MAVKAQAWVGGKNRCRAGYGPRVLLRRLSPTLGTVRCRSPTGEPCTFGPHGRRAVVRHGREDTGVIADVGVSFPADVAVVRVEGGGAGDEIGTN